MGLCGGLLFPMLNAELTCHDNPECTRLALTVAACQFRDVRARCPAYCGECCYDDDECRGLGINDAMCKQQPAYQKLCRQTCGTCEVNAPIQFGPFERNVPRGIQGMR